MLEVGIITSDSSDNKLYYQVNQRYDYYVPLKAIFGDGGPGADTNVMKSSDTADDKYKAALSEINGLRLVIFAGVLVKGATTSVDVLIVGSIAPAKVKAFTAYIEKSEGREINYSVLSYDEFYYRLSVRDRFITEIINGKHSVVIDKDNILNKD